TPARIRVDSWSSKRHVTIVQRRRAVTTLALITPVDALEEALGALVPALGVEHHARVGLAGIAHREGCRREAALLLRGRAQLEDVRPDRLRQLHAPGVQLTGDAVLCPFESEYQRFDLAVVGDPSREILAEQRGDRLDPLAVGAG